MKRRTVVQLFAVAFLALVTTAVIQEMRQPRELRQWRGKVWGFIPYDFRWPTWERIKDSIWNPYETHILTSRVFGIGLAINFNALLTKLGLIQATGTSEENFLWPNESLRQLLKPGK